MTAPTPTLTVVIPTYNERERIAELVTAIADVCGTAGIEVEIIVVDDNSPDGTGVVADELARRFRMQVVHRLGKLGLGTAVMAGIGAASAERVAVMDADFSHPPSLLPTLHEVSRTTGADVVVASRYVPGGSTGTWPLARRLMSRLGCLLARPITPLRDPASGYFVIRRALVENVTIKAGGFKIGLELIVRGRARSLVEVPYRFDDRERGESKMSRKEAIGYLAQLRDLFVFSMFRGRVPIQYKQVTPRDVRTMTSASGRPHASRTD